MSLTADDFSYFTNKIYLPMLIAVLDKDMEIIKKLPFKLNSPYIAIVKNALNTIRKDLKETDMYLTRRNMRLVRGKPSDDYTEYLFINVGYEERHKYSNIQLRDKTEELMGIYLTKSS